MASVPSLCDILIPLEKSSRSASGAEGDKIALVQSRKNHQSCIRSPYTIHKFYKFLRRAHCEENLEFFERAHQFLQLKQNGNISEEKLLAIWNKSLYVKYIAVDSPKECNFSQDIREIFEECYANNKIPSDVDVLFAISHVMGLLVDGYHRFVNSVDDKKYRSTYDVSNDSTLKQDYKNGTTVSISPLSVDNISTDRNPYMKKPSNNGLAAIIQETSTDTTVESQNSGYISLPDGSMSATGTDSSKFRKTMASDFQKLHNSSILSSGKGLLQKLNFTKKRRSFKQPSGVFYGHYNNNIQRHLKRAKQSSTTVSSSSSKNTESSSSPLPLINKAIDHKEKSVEKGFKKLNLHDIN